jgi:hypothetical protein
MTTRQTRTALWWTGGATIALAAIATAGILVMPLELPAASDGAGISRAPATQSAAAVAGRNVPTLESFEQLWDLKLAGALTNEVAAMPATQPVDPVAVAQPVMPSVQLVGTAVEAGHSFALLVMPDGRIACRPVGVSEDGVVVESVAADRAVVRVNGQAVTLQLPKPGAG